MSNAGMLRGSKSGYVAGISRFRSVNLTTYGGMVVCRTARSGYVL